jgi:hypothetical protein
MLLKIGSKGSEVAAVQFAINSVLAPPTPLKVDGIFGPKTQALTQKYQSSRGLKPDGLVGPMTLDSLFQIVTMTARVRMRTNSHDVLVAAPRTTVGGLSNRPPPPARESPWMTEMRRAHEGRPLSHHGDQFAADRWCLPGRQGAGTDSTGEETAVHRDWWEVRHQRPARTRRNRLRSALLLQACSPGRFRRGFDRGRVLSSGVTCVRF